MLKGVILEGVCASGKSAVIQRILESGRIGSLPQKSLICLTEHHTQRVVEQLEDSGVITTKDNVDLLQGICNWIRQRARFDEFRKWEARAKTQHRIAYLLERFHLTHCVHYPHVEWADMAPIDDNLSALQAKIVLMTVSPESLWERLERRNEGWKKYMRRIGSDKTEVLEHYGSQQEELMRLVSRSSLPKLVLSSDEETPDSAADKVITFWMS